MEYLTREKLDGKGIAKITAWPSYIFQKIIFDKMGLFATDPIRVLVSMFCVYVLYSIIYMILPVVSDTAIMTGLSEPENLSNVALSFYYSAITFFTIGYGDYYPEGYIRWVACIEGFSGVFMMSYFVVAFVRKIFHSCLVLHGTCFLILHYSTPYYTKVNRIISLRSAGVYCRDEPCA